MYDEVHFTKMWSLCPRFLVRSTASGWKHRQRYPETESLILRNPVPGALVNVVALSETITEGSPSGAPQEFC